jgi:hypothetical protein
MASGPRAMFGALLCSALIASTVACEELSRSLGGGDNSGQDAGSTSDGAASPDASIVGGGCGVEQQTGATLCIATSMCPEVVVDTQAMPSCGFRVRGASVDLVCACGTALCPMGTFATCGEAVQLLTNQTESAVCVQVAEGRCIESTASTSSSTSSTSSSASSSSGGNPACDRQCVKDCGGGAACASVCNCN